nr:GrpB family protein [Spirosoma sp. KNUC1025]
MPQLTQPIQIVDYQPNWPDLFHQEAKCIRQILGSTILALDHIGSTAVPGS